MSDGTADHLDERRFDGDAACVIANGELGIDTAGTFVGG
jgi:hypothetical protein